MNEQLAKVPHFRFSHMGLCTINIDRMEQFYVDVLGFTVTDRGNALGCDLVFLSRESMDHHQIVLGTGRPANLPQNTANPMFGPCINQMSFALDDLPALKAFNRHLLRAYPEVEAIYANHGTAWSIYLYDPERNFLEFFVDTEWYCEQPVFEPLDLSLDDEEIYELTERLAKEGKGFSSSAEWRAAIAAKMNKRRL